MSTILLDCAICKRCMTANRLVGGSRAGRRVSRRWYIATRAAYSPVDTSHC